MRCTPKLFDQRHDAFRMYCYTDSETLAAYRAYAEEHCVLCAAVGHRYDSSEPDEAEPEQQYYANIWKTMLESAGLEAEGAVVYVFSDNLYCTNAVYVTNERTGLFLVSCNNLYGLYS